MNPLYEMEMILTEDEFRKSCQALSSAAVKRLQIIYIVIGSICCLCGIAFILSPIFSLVEGLIIAIAGVVLCGILNLNLMVQTKKDVDKAWEAHPELHDIVIHITFFEDHFTQTTPTVNSNADYTDLKKIIETETNYYLMTGETSGAIVVKDRCASGLIDFIQNLQRRINS